MSAVYVILTSKPGQFHTEVVDPLHAVESYEYVFHGRLIARFVIAELNGAARVRVIDETEPVTVNPVPAKLLEKFDSIEAARRQLAVLARPGSPGASLQRLPRD